MLVVSELSEQTTFQVGKRLILYTLHARVRRRKGGWGPSGRTSTSSLDEANAVADAIAASGPSSSRSEGRSAAAAAAAVASSGVAGGSGTAEGLAANTAAREQQQQRPASAAMQLTRLNSMDSVSLTDEGPQQLLCYEAGLPPRGSCT